MIVCLSSFQLMEEPIYTKTQVDLFIREVFADQADDLVFKSQSDRLGLLQDFLTRFHIEHHPEYAGKKFKKLSEVALFNKYNQALTRDDVLDPKVFNPLKYRFPTASKNKEVFRFDGTDFLLVIQPIN